MNVLLFQPTAFVVAIYMLAGGNSAKEIAFNPAVLIASLYVFMLAAFLGFHLISRVPPLLHTPLMSATNAISGISLIGSLVVAGADYSALSTFLGFLAVSCSATNVVGGFLITDRMLKMFKEGSSVCARRPQASVIELLFVPARSLVCSY